jgi:hypothetical protein
VSEEKQSEPEGRPPAAEPKEAQEPKKEPKASGGIALDTVWKKALAGFSAAVALLGGVVGVTSQFAKSGPTLLWSTIAFFAVGIIFSVIFSAVYTYRKTEITVTVGRGAVISILILAVISGVGYGFWHHSISQASAGGSRSDQPGATTGSSSAQTPVGSTTTPAGNGSSARTHTEIVDYSGGIQVFANDQGAASNDPKIRFGTSVQVLCRAPNYSGIQSINAFYLITGGAWAGTYASANSFANGDTPGNGVGAPLDPAVPECTTAQLGQ